MTTTIAGPGVRSGWSRPVSNDEAQRSASGRRHYNAVRQLRAATRREDLIRLWGQSLADGGPGLFAWGVRAGMARQLGVARSTVTRDFEKIFSQWQTRPCPSCHSLVEERRWSELETEGEAAAVMTISPDPANPVDSRTGQVGRIHFPPLPYRSPRHLTPIEREAEVLKLLVFGESVTQIAGHIHKTPAAVRNILSRAAVRELTYRGVDRELACHLVSRRKIGERWELPLLDRFPPVCAGCASAAGHLTLLARGVYGCAVCLNSAGPVKASAAG